LKPKFKKSYQEFWLQKEIPDQYPAVVVWKSLRTTGLDNRLTDGGKVISPMHPPHFTPQKHYYFNVSGTHFC
jgi:hypothetical protein